MRLSHPSSPLTHMTIVNLIYNKIGLKLLLDHLINDNLKRWHKALSNELGWPTQRNFTGVKWTNTMDFIHHFDIPYHSKITYASFVCDYRPLRSELWRVRLVIGEDKLSYLYDTGPPAVSLLETKIMLNSVVWDADKGARFMTLDLKDLFLASPMNNPEYIKMSQHYTPPDIIQKHMLQNLKGVYGLKQASLLVYNFLV